PSGNLIATTRVFAGVRSVWFFERNGQYRHHFDIGPAGSLRAESISWNLDSSVLTVHLANAVSREHQLQFWTVSNYDWSLKLQLNSTEPILYAAWDPENAHRFHLLKASGRYERIEFERVYNCADMIAVSASGKKLRVTDLKLAPIPPPMSHYELALPSTVVGLCQSDSALAVLTSDGALTKYTLESRRYVASKTLDLAAQLGDRVLYGLQWKSDNILSAQRTTDHFEIVEIDLEEGKIDVVFTSSKPLAWHAFSASRGRYICEFEDGKCALVEAPTESRPLLLDGQQVEFKAVSCHRCQLIDSLDTVVVLSRNHQLIVNGNVVHSAVGSYSIAGDFLLAVTLTNTLFAIPLADLTKLRSGSFPTVGGRAVERGAAVIAHEPYGTRVWLQMPRGNLEVIQPRVLLVQQLKRLLDGLQFADALKQMRRHRVDMNLLYDHNPEAFLSNINKFVDQVDDADLLNLFILTLTSEDSTTTLFAAQYPDRKPTPDAGKVAKICVALRQYLLSLDTARLQRLYTATLSCFVKEGGARVSDALSDVQRRVAEANGKGQQLLEKWLRHLTYLVDERTLFNQALKTYDLKIALTVIQASEQDPKEYLALLNELDSKTPDAYRRYHIDLRLEDWSSALEHIAHVDERFDECIQHINQHDLYSNALSVFRGTPKYKEICAKCAEHSLTKARYDEAALLFQRCYDIANALRCYELARDHRKYVELAEAHSLPREQIVATLKKLVPQHESRNNYAAVADMLAYIDEE
ncbi:elongator complex protein 1, partial [Aphelenchoides avenae]